MLDRRSIVFGFCKWHRSHLAQASLVKAIQHNYLYNRRTFLRRKRTWVHPLADLAIAGSAPICVDLGGRWPTWFANRGQTVHWMDILIEWIMWFKVLRMKLLFPFSFFFFGFLWIQFFGSSNFQLFLRCNLAFIWNIKSRINFKTAMFCFSFLGFLLVNLSFNRKIVHDILLKDDKCEIFYGFILELILDPYPITNIHTNAY